MKTKNSGGLFIDENGNVLGASVAKYVDRGSDGLAHLSGSKAHAR